MSNRKVKKKIPKGRYCYEWAAIKTGKVKICPFFKYVKQIEDIPLEYRSLLENQDPNDPLDWCMLVKDLVLDQIKSCNHKLEY